MVAHAPELIRSHFSKGTRLDEASVRTPSGESWWALMKTPYRGAKRSNHCVAIKAIGGVYWGVPLLSGYKIVPSLSLDSSDSSIRWILSKISFSLTNRLQRFELASWSTLYRFSERKFATSHCVRALVRTIWRWARSFTSYLKFRFGIFKSQASLLRWERSKLNFETLSGDLQWFPTS